MSRWFPFLLLPLGYVLGWFVFGLAPWPLALLLLALMLALAYWQDKGRGITNLMAFTLLLFGAALLVGSVATLGALFSRTATHSADFVLPVAGAALMISLVILAPLVLWLRRTKPCFPSAPWLLLTGVLSFAFFPAVRVDCRQLQKDDFLSFSSNFQSNAQIPRWVRQPQSLPDRAELPTNFKVEQVRAGLVGCQRTPFTFQAVHPLLIVHLTDHVQPGTKVFAAAFSLAQHRKLTSWVAVKETPFSLALRSYKVGYGVPGWSTFPSYPAMPPEIAVALGQK